MDDFLALAEHGSFTKAAEVRHVTQSGFSRRIRSLECALGVDLVQRNVFPTTLTTAGTDHIEDMRLLLKQYDDLQIKITESDRQEKMLTLTTQHALSIYFFPKWYRDIKSTKSVTSIRVYANDFHDCLVTFLAGQCDFLLCYHSADICPELDRTDIKSMQIGTDELIPVVLANSPYSQVENDSSNIPLVGYPSESYFGRLLQLQIIDKLPATLGFDLVIETALSDSIKSMVMQGVGIGWLPKAMVVDELESGVLVQVSGIPSLSMDIMLYRHAQIKNAEVDSIWKNNKKLIAS